MASGTAKKAIAGKVVAGFVAASVAFVYIDDDDIPELLAEGKSTREGSDIYYLGSDHEAHFIPMDFGQVCIAERKGFLDNHWTRQNMEGHRVYQLEQGEIKELGEEQFFSIIPQK